MTTQPQFTFCICPDSSLLRLHIEKILKNTPPSLGGSWQTFTFWGDEPLSSSFWEHLTLQGLFATPKAIIIRHAEHIPAETFKELSATLLRVANHVWPILCLEVGIEKGKAKVAQHIQKLACYQKAEKNKWLNITLPLDAKTFPSFLQKEALALGFTLSNQEAALLATHIPEDAALALSELSKLALAVNEQGQLPADFLHILSTSTDLSLFDFIKVIQTGKKNAPEAWKKIIYNQTGEDISVFAVIALFLREARILWQCITNEPSFLPAFVIQTKTAQARKLGLAGISKLWEFSLVAEKSIKTGEYSPEQALEILIANIFLLFDTSQIT